jgi:hypothetical protein
MDTSLVVDSDDDLCNLDLNKILAQKTTTKSQQQQQQANIKSASRTPTKPFPSSSLSSSSQDTNSQNSHDDDSFDAFIPPSQCFKQPPKKLDPTNKENSFVAEIIQNKLAGSRAAFSDPMSSQSNRKPFDSQFQTLTMDSQVEVSQTSQMKRARFLEADFLKSTNPCSSPFMKTNSSEFSSQFQTMLTTQTQTRPVGATLKARNTAENSFYGLPSKVKDLLRQLRQISSLYEWQDELLKIMLDKYEIAWNNLQEDIDDDLFTNLLYLSPTSAGKTLVAEMIILHCLLVRKKNCIFTMPFVSIVQEKVQSISEFAEGLNFFVEEYAGVKGRVPPLKRQASKGKCTLYICTIEKAHSLVNSLIETDRLADEIGLVVADELHMIGDGSRGAIYEMILSKINYSSENILIQNKSVINFFFLIKV